MSEVYRLGTRESLGLSHIHFVQSLEPLEGGGLGGAALQLHRALVERGNGSHLFTTKATGVEGGAGVDQLPRSGPDKAFYASALLRSAESALSGGRVVVHGHGFYVYPNWVFGSQARKRGVPLVYHPHGMFEPWILRRSRWKKRLAHWLFEDANFAHAGLWRALTSKEADQIRAQGITAPIVVAPNGIDVSVYRPEEHESCGMKTILFLGRIHPKKGLDLLLRAWASARAGTKGWRLVIAGPDEGGYAATIKATIESEGLRESVTLAGVVSGKAKLELIQSADVFVLTSYSEGLPMAVLEAMACAVPVWITDACNLPEVGDSGAGWVCRPENESVSATFNEVLMSDAGERRQRGLAARQLVERRFQWSAIADQLHQACAALVHNPRLAI